MQNRCGFVCALAFALQIAASGAAFAAPRISFLRTIAPPHDLGHAEDVAVIYAIGDNAKVTHFVDVLVDQTNNSGTMRAVDATVSRQTLQPDDATLKKLRKQHPADAYLGVSSFTCTTQQLGGEGSTRDVDGSRVRRRHVWIDAVCEARVDVMSAADGKRMFSYQARGEGTSPRVGEISDEERNIALDQAARYAAVMASEGIAPRRVRESIELDENAPAFDDGYTLIDRGQLSEARALWEKALRQHRHSGPLHFNIAAVCEAMGDLDGAAKHFIEARRIAPEDGRYRAELRQFVRRNHKKAPPESAALPERRRKN